MPQPPCPPTTSMPGSSVPTDASPEAIEVAWRALLRRHHPDVAGPDGLEQAKRINVAHDWLSDPALRARYDRERGLVPGRGARRAGTDRRRARDARRPAHGSPLPRRAPPDRGPGGAFAVPRPGVAALRPAPSSTGSRSPSRRRSPSSPRSGASFRSSSGPPSPGSRPRSAPASRRRANRPTIRDAVLGYGAELVLGGFLDELLTEPFRGRARERLTRGWDAAVGQPRYGPDTRPWMRSVGGSSRSRPGPGSRRLARGGGHAPRLEGTVAAGRRPGEEDALRVLILAARDVAAAVAPGLAAAERSRAPAGGRRMAHLLVPALRLRPGGVGALTGPWRLRRWCRRGRPRCPSPARRSLTRRA